MRIYCPTGALGLGFLDSSHQRAISMKPDVIACDAGSTDSGPFYLGAGEPKMSREALIRDVERMLLARHQLNVPLIIGSCGTSGVDRMVDMMADLIKELANKHELVLNLATIKGEQRPNDILEYWQTGRVSALPGAPRSG